MADGNRSQHRLRRGIRVLGFNCIHDLGVLGHGVFKCLAADGQIEREESEQRRFNHVRDCVEIMLWLRDNPAVSGLFNVGTGQARTWWELAKAMFAAANKPFAIEFIDMPAEMSANYQNYTQADIGKLRRAGFDRPFTNLEDGVLHYMSNYLAKEDVYL